MRTTSSLVQHLVFTIGFFFCLSTCAYSMAAKYPMGDTGPNNLRRARRDILESLQPALAAVGADPVVLTTGTNPGDVQEIELGGLASSPIPDVVPEEDEPLTGTPALEDTLGPLDSSFIEADTGDSATVQDSTTFLGTEPVETGTTPPAL